MHYINALKAECKKIKGNRAVLADLMKLTFAGQRKTISHRTHWGGKNTLSYSGLITFTPKGSGKLSHTISCVLCAIWLNYIHSFFAGISHYNFCSALSYKENNLRKPNIPSLAAGKQWMNPLAVQNPHHECDLGNNLRMIQSGGNNCR